jgi:hypothetical protein
VSAPHRPGQAPWPERPAPIQFHSEPPPRQENPVLIWILRGLGLLAVAVISGLVWWYINDDTKPVGLSTQPTTSAKTGQFEFKPAEQAPQPRRDSSCAEHAYGDIQKFFKSTPCEALTRALYTTVADDGRKVYTNVSVVRMRNTDDAAHLRELTDKDGTGNVSDLVKDGTVKLPPLKNLAGGGGYKAVQHDTNVIIVESDFDPAAKRADKTKDEAILDAICEDVIRLADQIGG